MSCFVTLVSGWVDGYYEKRYPATIRNNEKNTYSYIIKHLTHTLVEVDIYEKKKINEYDNNVGCRYIQKNGYYYG